MRDRSAAARGMSSVLMRLICALAFGAFSAGAQGVGATGGGAITGRVVDSATRLPIASAIITITGTTRGTQADTAGVFRLDGVPAGPAEVRARLVGYTDRAERVVVIEGSVTTIEFVLTRSVQTLGAVRSEAKPIEREVFDTRPLPGTVIIPGKAVSRIPRFGEADVLRAAQLLPGVQARNDFSAGLNVRGGEADQNLILMDGFPIFNPFHFGGLFGTFIDGAVANLELYTGGFPAAYGGRLSSVLDVRSTEETRTGLHGSSTVSMLASNVVLGSALPNRRGSWLVAGRRTYADVVLKLIGKDLIPYHFRDAQAHATYQLSPTVSLMATVYNGRDDINVAQTFDQESFRFWWGNTVAGVRLQASPNGRPMEQRLSWTRFATAVDIAEGQLILENGISEIRAGGQMRVGPTDGAHRMTLGYEVTQDRINYDVGSGSADARFYTKAQNAIVGAAFLDDEWKISPRLLAQVGVRAEALAKTDWREISPRGSLKWFANEDLAFTVGVGRYTQWLHSLAREDIPIRLFDFWQASDSTTPVSRAMQYGIGTEVWLAPDRFLRVEAYRKRYDALLEPNPGADANATGDEFKGSRGKSDGIDLMVRQLDRERWGGWLSYSYSYNRRQSDTLSYYPAQDRRHNVNLVVMYRPKPRYSLSARWGFAGGTPFTDIIGQFGPHGYNLRGNQWVASDSTRLEPIGGPRNGSRYPFTQRLDLSVTRDYREGRTISPFLSLINAYNAQNVFTYVFDYGNNPPTRRALSQLPLLPTFGVTVTF